jgi:hypothetical protein
MKLLIFEGETDSSFPSSSYSVHVFRAMSPKRNRIDQRLDPVGDLFFRAIEIEEEDTGPTW